jgi:hypothetical protein
MQLKEFSLISPVIESGLVLKAIETAISPETIEQVLGNTDSREERRRKLPSHLVVCLVIAMSLWSSDSMRTVLKNLVKGLRTQWLRLAQYWHVPSPSSITEAASENGMPGNEPVIQPGDTSNGFTTNSGRISVWMASDGSRWHRTRRA